MSPKREVLEADDECEDEEVSESVNDFRLLSLSTVIDDADLGTEDDFTLFVTENGIVSEDDDEVEVDSVFDDVGRLLRLLEDDPPSPASPPLVADDDESNDNGSDDDDFSPRESLDLSSTGDADEEEDVVDDGV
jgi:hypothetical protein